MHTCYTSNEAEQVKSQRRQNTTTMGHVYAFPTSLSLDCIFFLVVGHFAILHLSISFKNLINLLRTSHRSKNEDGNYIYQKIVFSMFFSSGKSCVREERRQHSSQGKDI